MSTDNEKRLLAALGGSSAGWTYTGRVESQDPRSASAVACACGHKPIKWLYHWKHADGRALVTGSECVERVPGLDVDSIGRIKLHVRALKAELAKKDRERLDLEKANMVQEFNHRINTLIDGYVATIDQTKEWQFMTWAINFRFKIQLLLKSHSQIGTKLSKMRVFCAITEQRIDQEKNRLKGGA